MKLFKLAALPVALFATSAFAEDVVVDQQVIAQPVAVSTTTYNPEAGVVKNTTTQLVDSTKTVFGTIFHPAAVSAEVGTLGYGANLGWALNDKTELVAGWAGGDLGDIKDNFDVKDVNYNVETDFSNPYVGVQMRPASNWLTVGAGTIFPDNEIKVKANPTNGSVKIKGKEYQFTSNDATLNGTIKNKNDIAPYLTVGFRPNLNNHWGVFGELGAAYMGRQEVEVTGKGTFVEKNTGLTRNADFVANKAKKELEAQDYTKWWPIAKLGLTYRF